MSENDNQSTEVAQSTAVEGRVMPVETVTDKPKMKFMDDKEEKELFLERMAQLGGNTFTADSGVDYHDGTKISLPNGMTPAKGAEILNDVAASLAQEEDFTRTFRYRPWDGAHAVTMVMRKYFGTTGRGKTIFTMFGPIAPRHILIDVDAQGNTEQVPWGHIAFAQVDGTLMLDGTYDEEYGLLFQLTVHCPKRYAASVQGFFVMVEQELNTNSIYKGKSIKGTDEPRFINDTVDPTIVYSDEVNAALDATVWGVIRNANLLKADGRKVNYRVLLHGPYGTGKSEAGRTTAKVANENNWTFIQFHSGRSSLEELEKTVQLARLYSPAVLFIEDIDIYARAEGLNAQSRITNLFDGIGSKGDEVMIVMTSNHAAEFSKGMLRAGRVDRMIYIGSLDEAATEQLIRRVIGDNRLGDVDFEQVHEALKDFEPAFVRQTFDQAATTALIRTESRNYLLNTEDFVTAANLLRPQHDLHTQKADEKKEMTLDTAFKQQIREVIEQDLTITGKDMGEDYKLTVRTVEH